MTTAKHPTKKYTEKFASDLAAFLSAPPEPPRRVFTLLGLLRSVEPQIRALFGAGYSADQIMAFLAAKDVPVDHPSVARFMRNVQRRKRAPRGSAPESVESTVASTAAESVRAEESAEASVSVVNDAGES